MTTAAGDPEGQARIAAFLQGLQPLGWTVGANVRIDIRFAVEPERIRQEGAQLTALAPDIVLANSSAGIGAIRAVPCIESSCRLLCGARHQHARARHLARLPNRLLGSPALR